MKLMDSKAGLYIRTLRYMKCSQVYRRIMKKAGFGCGTGVRVQADLEKYHPVGTVEELDLDKEFLKRFSVRDLMNDRFSFLHSEAERNGSWEIRERSALWNYNLHYFEYLFPLLAEFRKAGGVRYLEKAVFLIKSWIRRNPKKAGGPGWEPYTIDLRLVNWLSFYSMAEKELPDDFRRMMRSSILEQYKFLSRHLEKDILGNHYFEDLKTLILCAVFFEDRRMLERVYPAFLKECKEEILGDGMHFELSPMYHRIILEGVIKAYAALKEYGYPAEELTSFIRSMSDASWSMEESLNRIPLFNDCGDNVAKSLKGLLAAAKKHAGIIPRFRSAFPDAGFYIFRRDGWKLIVDAGAPGPSYIPGHAHCDALSFELYRDGEPVITNCGTFAYQSELRGSFRNTSSHNTVMVNGTEQSQCWGIFRMAGRSKVRVIDAGKDHIRAEMTDHKGQKVHRTIKFGRKLTVTDESPGNKLTGFVHWLQEIPAVYRCDSKKKIEHLYAPEYGCCKAITASEYSGTGKIGIVVRLE